MNSDYQLPDVTDPMDIQDAAEQDEYDKWFESLTDDERIEHGFIREAGTEVAE